MNRERAVKSEGTTRGAVTATNEELGSVAIRGGAIRVAGYVAGVVVSLGTAAILVRHLGIADFGRYVTVLSLIALVGGVTEAGIQVYGIREFNARREPQRRKFMADLLGLRLALTTLGVGCACGFALAVGYEQVLILGTLVAGAGLLLQVTADVLSVALQAQLQLARVAAVDITRRLLALLFIGVLALLGARVLPLLAAQVAAAGLAMLLLARMVRSTLRIWPSFSHRAWRLLMRDTSVYAIAMSIGAIYFYVTVVLMSLIASPTQTGFFATAFRVTQVALGIPVLLLTAIFPLMSRDRITDEHGNETIGKVFHVAIICGVWLSLTIALGAEFLIDVIAGSKGQGAVPVLQIQGIVLTASFISASSSLRLMSLRRYRPLIVMSISSLAVNIALGLLLIPDLGARGGALADVITEVLAAGVLTTVLIRAVPQHGIRGSALQPVLVAAGLAATMFFVPLGSLGRAICATVVYFGVLVGARALPDELIAAIPRTGLFRARR